MVPHISSLDKEKWLFKTINKEERREKDTT
jgi:hypothetical protein